MTLKTVEVEDANGAKYIAYVAYTKKGNPVYLDKALGDSASNLMYLMATEVLAHEEMGF